MKTIYCDHCREPHEVSSVSVIETEMDQAREVITFYCPIADKNGKSSSRGI